MICIAAVGDVVGRAGRVALETALPVLRKRFDPDFILLNGENAAGGFGLTEKIYQQFIQDLNIDAVTMGNHWHDKKEIFQFSEQAQNLVLPANMGNIRDEHVGLRIIKNKHNRSFAVINLIGRVFMHEGNRHPFEAASRLVEKIPADVKLRIVDMHAEASSEKQAMAFYLCGKVSLVYGTHSHVPTADERIINEKTGYLTDIGMTGSYDSIIGMQKEHALKRILTSDRNIRLEPASHDLWFCALLAYVDETTGNCQRVERVQWRLNQMDVSK